MKEATTDGDQIRGLCTRDAVAHGRATSIIVQKMYYYFCDWFCRVCLCRVLLQESGPLDLYFPRESLKLHSRTESSSKAAFLDHSETLWMRSAAAWWATCTRWKGWVTSRSHLLLIGFTSNTERDCHDSMSQLMLFVSRNVVDFTQHFVVHIVIYVVLIFVFFDSVLGGMVVLQGYSMKLLPQMLRVCEISKSYVILTNHSCHILQFYALNYALLCLFVFVF